MGAMALKVASPHQSEWIILINLHHYEQVSKTSTSKTSGTPIKWYQSPFMGPKKGGPPPPPPPPSSSSEFPPLSSHSRSSSSSRHPDPNPLELDLQLHRDQTSANFHDIRESLEYMRSQNSALRSELLEEIRQLRVGPKNPCEVAGTSQAGGSPSSRLSSPPKTSSSSPPASVHPPVSLASSALGNGRDEFCRQWKSRFIYSDLSQSSHRGLSISIASVSPS